MTENIPEHQFPNANPSLLSFPYPKSGIEMNALLHFHLQHCKEIALHSLVTTSEVLHCICLPSFFFFNCRLSPDNFSFLMPSDFELLEFYLVVVTLSNLDY